jgi:hypothetical protein
LYLAHLLLLEQVDHFHSQGFAQPLGLDDVDPKNEGLELADDGLVEALAKPVGDFRLGKP